jgi:L-ascorbate metabolism protein UlaG (beta-lactamase superfamily)
MPVTLTFLGHAGFVLEDGEHSVAIDPFLTGNPVATLKPEEIHCQSIVLTHGHADHLGDTVAIAKANGATVYAAFEIAGYLGDQGCNTEPANPGGKIKGDFGWVAFTQAFHSSSYEGRYMG